MPTCLFVSDLHGRPGRLTALVELLDAEPPRALFLGGDVLPGGPAGDGWLLGRLGEALARLRDRQGARYPRVFLILGNDDPRIHESDALAGDQAALWTYVHGRKADLDGRAVYGYACIPPSPFALKDWERYDVSRYVDPGAVSPEEGRRTVAVEPGEIRHGTIARDLERLVGQDDLSSAVLLFHAPPYRTLLDRAALDGRAVDHAPLDVHVGSVAIRRFVEARQPAVTLHGHVHEAARLTGAWRDRLGSTWMFGAAHDGPELAVVRFDPDFPERAERTLRTPASFTRSASEVESAGPRR